MYIGTVGDTHTHTHTHTCTYFSCHLECNREFNTLHHSHLPCASIWHMHVCVSTVYVISLTLPSFFHRYSAVGHTAAEAVQCVSTLRLVQHAMSSSSQLRDHTCSHSV